MKNLIVLTVLFFSINTAFSFTRNISVPEIDTLVGYFEFSELQEGFYQDWFTPEYSNYQVDKNTLDSLMLEDLTNIKIIVVIGTWCHDSQRETPRLVKILKYIKFDNTVAIGVNREKQAEGTEVPDLNIEFVPTIIVYQENKEIGRIIETPKESLENDLFMIIRSNNMQR